MVLSHCSAPRIAHILQLGHPDNAGIVDQNIETAPFSGNAFDEPIDLGPLRHIGKGSDRAPPKGCNFLLDDGKRGFVRHTNDGDIGALGGKSQRHRPCQWRSKKGPPWRCKKGPLGGCGLVP